MKKHFVNNQLIVAGLLAATLIVPAAHAVDGVLEISQACASFGCLNGDSGGLPVTITESGSYRLTSNLTTTSVNTTLIEVTTSNVSIDLNGFTLSGPVTCTATNTVTCSASGSGTGIDATSQENIIIRNGTVTGMGSAGIIVGRGAYLEQLVLAENGGTGIVALAPGSVLRRLSVRENGGAEGVALGFGSSYLMDSTVYNNGGIGVFGGFCGNVLMSSNRNGDPASGRNACSAIAPNFCSVPTDCD